MSEDKNEIELDITAHVKSIVDIMNILNEMDNASMMLQALASCTATVLCSSIASEDEAKEQYDLFDKIISLTINQAKSSNLTMWAEGTPH